MPDEKKKKEIYPTHPLLHLQVGALDEHRQPVDHELAGLLRRRAVGVALLALQHGGKQLGCVLNVHGLDVAGQGSHLGTEHGLQRLHRVLQVPVEEVGGQGGGNVPKHAFRFPGDDPWVRLRLKTQI